MLKIKLFSRTNKPNELTTEVNNWLTKVKEWFTIDTINYKTSGRMDTTIVVMITYNDNGKTED